MGGTYRAASTVTPPAYRRAHGLPREGRAAGTGTRDARAEHDPAGHRHRARRRQVVGVALGPRRPVHAVEAPHRPADAVRTRSTKPSSPRSPRSNAEGIERIGTLSDAAFLAAGVALYAGEGAKTRRQRAASRTPIRRWSGSSARGCGASSRSTRRDSACACTSTRASISTLPKRTGRASRAIPRSQFRQPYRAVADPSIRRNKHEFGCVYVGYSCSTTHRRIMGLVRALLSSSAIPG